MKYDTRNSCIEWSGSISPEGYARYGGKYIHRILAEAFKGPIPAKYVIDHRCRNRKCINPHHLEIVSFRENILRGLQGRLKTHCPHGHEYKGINIGWQKCKESLSGYARLCLTCRRLRDFKIGKSKTLILPTGLQEGD